MDCLLVWKPRESVATNKAGEAAMLIWTIPDKYSIARESE